MHKNNIGRWISVEWALFIHQIYTKMLNLSPIFVVARPWPDCDHEQLTFYMHVHCPHDGMFAWETEIYTGDDDVTIKWRKQHRSVGFHTTTIISTFTNPIIHDDIIPSTTKQLKHDDKDKNNWGNPQKIDSDAIVA